jgi:hypothetical protein
MSWSPPPPVQSPGRRREDPRLGMAMRGNSSGSSSSSSVHCSLGARCVCVLHSLMGAQAALGPPLCA